MDRQPNPSIQESSVDQEKKPDSTVKSGIQYTRRFAWPLAVIVGQAFLLVISFAFFAAVRSRGQIPLQWLWRTKYSFIRSPRPMSLFSQAVRHAILVYLTGPMSIANLGFGISISKRNLIFERGEIRWVLVGAVFFLATLGQTPSWNSLLTPTTIGISTPLRGSEIDLTSNALSDQFWDLWNGSSSGIQFYLESALSSVIGPSGAASADSQIGYIRSSILPVGCTLVIRGLNAIVSCQYQQLNANTDPALTRSQSNLINIVAGDQTVSHTVVGIATVCPNGPRVHTGKSQIPYILLFLMDLFRHLETLTSTNDTLLAISCGIIDDAGTTTYSTTDILPGIYSYPNGDSVVCRVTPQTQNFNVTYSEEFIYKNLDSEPLDPDIKPAPPLVAFAAIHGLDQAFFYGQSGTPVTKHTFGELSHFRDGVCCFFLFRIVQAVKYDLALDNGPLGGDPPSSLTREITGNALTTTIGWGIGKERRLRLEECRKHSKGWRKKDIKEGSAKKLKLGKVGSEDGEGFEMLSFSRASEVLNLPKLFTIPAVGGYCAMSQKRAGYNPTKAARLML
ncbi:hypothetical protein B0H13DRAFT_2409489 [Mycena leptocephala]|nr:hypothetical protein B0H13DRAFT_2409489 [Mycena leptocephala]